jgi:hypothetical protein
MMRDFAQDMNRALATAEAALSAQTDLLNKKIAMIARVRELHTEMNNSFNACQECLLNYPCPTIRALDGA